MAEHYLGLEEILEVIDNLSKYQGKNNISYEHLEEKYRIRTTLIPLWKNYISIYMDRFNRYKEMTDYGTFHISNLITLAADLLLPEYEKKAYKDISLNAEELFILIAGIFLHDIGMAEIKKPSGDLYEIRKKHGILSYELLLFNNSNHTDLLPTMNEEEKELIALICLHHQTEALIGEYDTKKFLEFPEKGKKPFKEVRCLNNIYKNGAKFNGIDVKPHIIVSILRLLNACDIQYTRAGSFWLSRPQLENNRLLLKEIEHEIGKMEHLDIDKEIIEEKEKKITYLKKQKRDYLKNLVIEKTWIVNNNVIVKTVPENKIKEIREFAMEPRLNPQEYYKEFFKDLKEEYYYIKEYIENYDKLNFTLNFDYSKTEYDENTDMAIEMYDKKKHLKNIIKKPHYKNFLTNNLPEIKNNFRKGFIEELINEKAHIQIIVSPAESGKTEVAANLIEELKKKHSVEERCIFGYIFRGDTNDFMTLLIKFIAASGNYYYYNQSLMKVDLIEKQWSELFEYLNNEEFYFIFDDMDTLPLDDIKTAEYNFMRSFFANVTKPEFFIFTGKVSRIFRDMKEKINILTLPPLDIEEIVENFNKEFNFEAKVYKKIENIFYRFNQFPDIIEAFKENLKKSKDLCINQDDLINLLDFREREIRNELCSKLFRFEEKKRQIKLLSNIRFLPDFMTRKERKNKLMGKIPDLTDKDFDELIDRGFLDENIKINGEWYDKILIPPVLDNISDILQEKVSFNDEENKIIWNSEENYEDYIFRIIPPLIKLKGLKDEKLSHLDAWDHTLLVCINVIKISIRPEDYFPEKVINKIKEYLQVPIRQILLLIASLLHDTGKPFVESSENETIRFKNHEMKGKEVVEKFLKDSINWDEEIEMADVEFITDLIEMHGLYEDLINKKEVKNNTLRVLLEKDSFPELIVLSMANLMAYKGTKATPEVIEKLKYLFERTCKLEKPYYDVKFFSTDDEMDKPEEEKEPEKKTNDG